MFKKITAMTLAFIICIFALASCATDTEEIPDGMKPAYLTGEPFRLYIPEGWADNTRSGISGGYATLYVGVSVSARYDSSVSSETDATTYLEACSESYALTLTEYAKVDITDALLGGKDARRLTYTAKDDDGVPMTCTQISAKDANGLMISLYTYTPTEFVDAVSGELESIRANFVMTDSAPAVPNDAVTDKKTPAGMKIASDKNAAYRLYVPMSWVCEAESGRSEAHISEDGSNVSVTLYEPNTSMSVEDYFNICAEEYQKSLAGYELIGSIGRTVASRSAISYTYSAQYGNAKYRIMQTVFSDGQIMYSITYTALDENFDAHMTDVEQILSSFIFR